MKFMWETEVIEQEEIVKGDMIANSTNEVIFLVIVDNDEETCRLVDLREHKILIQEWESSAELRDWLAGVNPDYRVIQSKRLEMIIKREK
jgi:hypothetical protein